MINYGQVVASHYVHELWTGREAVAGWGIYDATLGDWVVDDGYESEAEAKRVADALNAVEGEEARKLALLAEWTRLEAPDVWKFTPHGLKENCSMCCSSATFRKNTQGRRGQWQRD